jgi:Bacterial dnaA protein helix-turn-helix
MVNMAKRPAPPVVIALPEPKPKPVDPIKFYREIEIRRCRIVERSPHAKVMRAVRLLSRLTGVSREDIFSQRRHKEVVRVRHQAMWLAHKYTSWSLPKIGRTFGGRDHTTVIHGLRKIETKYPKRRYTVRNPAANPKHRTLAFADKAP